MRINIVNFISIMHDVMGHTHAETILKKRTSPVKGNAEIIQWSHFENDVFYLGPPKTPCFWIGKGLGNGPKRTILIGDTPEWRAGAWAHSKWG